MAQFPDLATFQQEINGICDSLVINQKPLAPNIKRFSDESNERKRYPENSLVSEENSLKNAVTQFLDPLEFLEDNHDGMHHMDNPEKPIAPSFGSIMEFGHYERNNSGNDQRNEVKNSSEIYPDCSSENNQGYTERISQRNRRGNSQGNLQENNSKNERSNHSEKRHFYGFVSNSEFPNPWRKPENINVYATKKTIAQGMLDVALLAANATQLKNLLVVGEAYQFYIFTLILVCLSIALQIVQGMILIVLGSVYNLNRQADQSRARLWNDISLAIMLLTVIINIVVASFALRDDH